MCAYTLALEAWSAFIIPILGLMRKELVSQLSSAAIGSWLSDGAALR